MTNKSGSTDSLSKIGQIGCIGLVRLQSLERDQFCQRSGLALLAGLQGRKIQILSLAGDIHDHPVLAVLIFINASRSIMTGSRKDIEVLLLGVVDNLICGDFRRMFFYIRYPQYVAIVTVLLHNSRNGLVHRRHFSVAGKI